MTTVTSFIDSGLKSLLDGYSGQFLATTTDYLKIVIPAGLAIWGAKVPLLKGTNWLKRQVFGR